MLLNLPFHYKLIMSCKYEHIMMYNYKHIMLRLDKSIKYNYVITYSHPQVS
jgi:hypothetical protein